MNKPIEELLKFDLDVKDEGWRSEDNPTLLITERNITALWKKQNEIIEFLNSLPNFKGA